MDDVRPGSPAAAPGAVQKGDVLVEVGGRSVRGLHCTQAVELMARAAVTHEGDAVGLVFLRKVAVAATAAV